MFSQVKQSHCLHYIRSLFSEAFWSIWEILFFIIFEPFIRSCMCAHICANSSMGIWKKNNSYLNLSIAASSRFSKIFFSLEKHENFRQIYWLNFKRESMQSEGMTVEILCDQISIFYKWNKSWAISYYCLSTTFLGHSVQSTNFHSILSASLCLY